MKISTPHGTLEGDNIEAILKEHGYDCLRGACLRDADLHGADMHGANLYDADLRYADLSGADLRDAYLSCACLYGADLSDADLSDADLSDVDLRYADLSDADLRDANYVQLSIAKTSILPEEGDIIGWKKSIRRRHNATEISHRKAPHSGRRATLQRHWAQMPRQQSTSA